MHCSLFFALVVAFAVGFSSAASIRKSEDLGKQSVQEKAGKEFKAGEVEKKKPQKGMDINQDGKISDEEYAAFLKRREEEFQNELREELKQTMKDFDKNGDGKLQADEVVHFLAATRGLRPKVNFKPIFAELDSNGDGGLDSEEVEFFLQHTPWNLLEEIPSTEMVA